MLIKPAPPVEAASGRLGQNVVLYVSRGRQMLRQWVYPTDPETALQQQLRAYMSQVAVAWQSVSDIEAAGWSDLAEQMKRVDSLGREYAYFANNAYAVVNVYRLLDGQSITDDAPTYNPPATPVITAAGHDEENLVVTVQHAQGTSGFFSVRATPALPSPRRLARKNELRYLSTSLALSIVPATASPQNVTVPTQRVSIEGGDYVGIEITPLSADYVPGNPIFLKSIELSSL